MLAYVTIYFGIHCCICVTQLRQAYLLLTNLINRGLFVCVGVGCLVETLGCRLQRTKNCQRRGKYRAPIPRLVIYENLLEYWLKRKQMLLTPHCGRSLLRFDIWKHMVIRWHFGTYAAFGSGRWCGRRCDGNRRRNGQIRSGARVTERRAWRTAGRQCSATGQRRMGRWRQTTVPTRRIAATNLIRRLRWMRATGLVRRLRWHRCRRHAQRAFGQCDWNVHQRIGHIQRGCDGQILFKRQLRLFQFFQQHQLRFLVAQFFA